MALVLAGGRGSRLKNLTDRRAKPAVYFGGKFRIIDFALSNCLNSGIRRIGVITQYKSHSLLRHLQRGWAFLKSEMNEFVDLLPAQQRVDEESWYRGTADAVYQNQDILDGYRAEYVVVLAGDHVYKMDYSVMLADHVEAGAGCTVGCIEVPREEAKAFGVMAIDEQRFITSFVEKPADPPPMPGHPDKSLASMGIYVFDARVLVDELVRDAGDAHRLRARRGAQAQVRVHHRRVPQQQVLGPGRRPALGDRVDRAAEQGLGVLHALLGQVHRRDMPYSYRTLNANYINAYTFPGGSVGATRGILLQMDNEAQLAAVLGREFPQRRHDVDRTEACHANGHQKLWTGVGKRVVSVLVRFSQYR